MYQDDLPLPQKLAIAHSSIADRRIIEPFFRLDYRLAQFVSQSKEPVLTQMRIAWWRDQLKKPVGSRPEGDPVLDALSARWCGEEVALIALVDGWEGLLAEPPLPHEASYEFVEGRGRCFAAISRLCDTVFSAHTAELVGVDWAYADLISRMSDPQEIEFVLAHANLSQANPKKLPYRLRSLSILGHLGASSLQKGGGSLINGRRDFLTIMRLGLIGR